MPRASHPPVAALAALVEPLERRALMSAAFVTDGSISFLADGVVTVQGTSYADRVDVTLDGRGTATTADDEVHLVLHTPGGPPASKTRYRTVPAAKLKRVVFVARQGGDTFVNATAVASTVYGGDGNDLLVGGRGNDRLYGQAGDDRLYGQAGTDWLFGGDGSDHLDSYGSYAPGSGDGGLYGGNPSYDVVHGDGGLDTFRTRPTDLTDRQVFEVLKLG